MRLITVAKTEGTRHCEPAKQSTLSFKQRKIASQALEEGIFDNCDSLIVFTEN